jgi:hypothetical protein
MSQLYLRRGILTVGERRFDVRLNFSVEKNSTSSSNKCTVTAYNLSENSRSFIEKKEGMLRLEAGYGNDTAIIFLGDIDKVIAKRQGPDILTIIESGDGEKRLADAHIELSLKAGATDEQIINAVINVLELERGTIKGIARMEYLNGFSFSGKAQELLDKITKKQKLEWSVQDGSLQIIPQSTDTGDTAVSLNSNTGLLDVPNKTDEGFVIKSLLNPKLVPGRQVKLESILLTGQAIFKVDKVTHVGDTQEGDFFTEVEGKEYV